MYLMCLKGVLLKRLMFFIIIGFMMFTAVMADEMIVVEDNFIDVFTGEIVLIEITFNIPEGYYAAYQEEFFGVDIVEEDGITAGQTIFPDGRIETDFGFSKYVGTITLLKEVHIARDARLGEREIELIVFYQLCLEDGTCLIPEEESFPLNLFVVQGLNVSSGGTFGLSGRFTTVLSYLLLAFIGGIILNLMPCVLPILSIRAFNLVKQSQDSHRDILINSLLYVGGIVASFVVMATIVTVIKLSGEMVGWGFQFQNPRFVIFLLSLMFVFSLSLFDVFTLQVPGMSTVSRASNKSGYWGSFLMGVFCVLLATPCTAPFLGAALGFAFTQPPSIIFAIFILVGLGLGFPFLVIGFYPQAVKLLPKPGEWMNVFKELLGFLLLAFAVSMVNVLLLQGMNMTSLLYFILILGLAAWLYGRFVTPMHSKTTQWIMTILAVLVIVFGAKFTLSKNSFMLSGADIEIKTDGFWQVFSEEAVAEGIAQGRAVFVEFTAAYCTVCKMNEAAVLNQSDIRQAFMEKDVLMLKGDFTRKDPVIHEWLMRHDRAGVPLYLLFVPGEDQPIQLPEVLTKNMVFNALERV